MTWIPRRALQPVAKWRTHGSLNGQALPPLELRMGGAHFESDERFVEGARRDVARLEEIAALTAESSLLDLGCGPGRLAVGITERFGRIRRYAGLEIHKPHVQWATRHFGDGFEFILTEAQNDRYNPDGLGQQPLPVTGSFDIAYAYSVFSHMRADDCRWFLKEFARLLRPGGFACLTAFVETGVEPEAENPTGWGPIPWAGPLHCVRFERSYFESFLSEAGLGLARFDHRSDTDWQSLIVATRQ